MQISSFGTTDRGQVRPANEDALYIDDAHQLYAVADGIGGLPDGADTSLRIVELIGQAMNRIDSNEERADLVQLITGINKIVAQEGLDAHPATGTGSTLTLAQIISDQLLIGHVGDSAAYLLRGEDFEKLTVDHTMAQELIDRQGDAAHAIMPPEYPHTLTRCVGQDNELRVDQNRISLERGDCLLLCTDGLNRVVEENQIISVLKEADSPESACCKLTDLANNNYGPDNITVVVVRIS